MRVVVPLLAAVAVVAAGCGSSSTAGAPATTATTAQTIAAPSASTAYSLALAKLCNQTRLKFEALGKPSEKPPAVLLPGTVKVAGVFVRDLRALHPSAAEKAKAAQLVRFYALWYEGDRYALVAVKRKNTDAFINLQEGADHWLGRAERIAVSLGAPQCRRRPFELP